MTGPAEDPPGTARALVITVSHRASTGVYADDAGPLLVAGLAVAGLLVDGPRIVDDGPALGAALAEALAQGYDVVVTTGGTGLSPTDATPEQTRPLLDREVPGLAEALRARGRELGVPTAALSRGLAGTAGRTLVVNVAGSPGACRDAVAVLSGVLPHAVDQMRGRDHDRSGRGHGSADGHRHDGHRHGRGGGHGRGDGPQ